MWVSGSHTIILNKNHMLAACEHILNICIMLANVKLYADGKMLAFCFYKQKHRKGSELYDFKTQ